MLSAVSYFYGLKNVVLMASSVVVAHTTAHMDVLLEGLVSAIGVIILHHTYPTSENGL
jgi:hypothetical protein